MWIANIRLTVIISGNTIIVTWLDSRCITQNQNFLHPGISSSLRPDIPLEKSFLLPSTLAPPPITPHISWASTLQNRLLRPTAERSSSARIFLTGPKQLCGCRWNKNMLKKIFRHAIIFLRYQINVPAITISKINTLCSEHLNLFR